MPLGSDPDYVRLKQIIQKKDSHEELRALLEAGRTDVNARSKKGETILFDAIRRGNSDVVKLLLQHKSEANVRDQRDDTPMLVAAFRGDNATIGILLAHKADIHHSGNSTPLYAAAQEGRLETVRFLIGCRVNVNDCTGWGVTALHAVADEYYRPNLYPNQIKILKMLLDHQGDVNLSKGARSPLDWAVGDRVDWAAGARVDVVCLMLENIINTPNIKLGIFNIMKKKGSIDAALQGEEGDSLIHWAARRGYFHLVAMLIQSGANLEKANAHGETVISLVRDNPASRDVHIQYYASAINQCLQALKERKVAGNTDNVQSVLNIMRDKVERMISEDTKPFILSAFQSIIKANIKIDPLVDIMCGYASSIKEEPKRSRALLSRFW